MCSCNDNDVVICSWLLLGHIIVRRLTTTHKPISYVHASSWPMKCVSCCCHWTQHGKKQTWNVWLDCANFPQVKTWERLAQSDQKWGRSAQSDQTISTVWSNDQHSLVKRSAQSNKTEEDQHSPIEMSLSSYHAVWSPTTTTTMVSYTTVTCLSISMDTLCPCLFRLNHALDRDQLQPVGSGCVYSSNVNCWLKPSPISILQIIMLVCGHI